MDDRTLSVSDRLLEKLVTAKRADASKEYQLAGGLVVAALLPFLMWVVTGKLSAVADYTQTTLMVCLAVLVGHLFVKELARYPGESPLSTSLPAVSASFGLVVLGITLTHAPYSRVLLLAGYLLTMVWYAATNSAKERYLRPRLALVPLGNTAEISQIGRVDWHDFHHLRLRLWRRCTASSLISERTE